ncbi:MAG: 4-hydroxy-tetrahydrodipicolinate reductase, partial [Chryseobacterium sp.]
VNLFFALNEKLAKLMQAFPEYKPQLEEIHHVHKKDAPSGTAISLAEGIIANSGFNAWKAEETQGGELGIFSIRTDEVPGTHSVRYTSQVDEIEIKHTAFNRSGFALGAVIAAEWLPGKQGVFGMSDVLGI